jgi:hypothetical protein
VTFRHNSIGAPNRRRWERKWTPTLLRAAARAAESDNCRGGSPKSTAQANTQIWNNHAWKRKVPCAVRNLSEIGACLVVQTTFGIPGTFKCVMPDRTPQTCQVIWRDDTKLGVRFQ